MDKLLSCIGVPKESLDADSKIFRFALMGAIGCLAGALLGELLLLITGGPDNKPPGQAVCLLIDCSGSMLSGTDTRHGSGDKVREVKSAATRFTHRQDLSQDMIAVVGFGSEVRTGSQLSRDAGVLAYAIENLSDGGSTAMAAGLNAATNILNNVPEQLRDPSIIRNVLLFTDGQPDDQEATLAAARICREQNIRIVTIATGDADVDYLARLTGNPALVVPTSVGNFGEGFEVAEEAIFGGSLMESSPSHAGFFHAMVQTSVWTALLAAGVSLALIVGQNLYVRRAPLSGGEAATGILGGLTAGIVAGATGQLLFTVAVGISDVPLLGSFLGWFFQVVGRIVGWAILGALVGRGLAFFVPNLEPRRAWLGGSFGGAIGAVAFLFASLLGDSAGRFLGAAVLGTFIGLMIALVDAAFRQAWLEVRYGLKETIRVSLGAAPVSIGSARSCTVYARDARPLAFQYRFEDGQVTCLDFSTERSTIVQPGDTSTIGNVTVSVHTSHQTAAVTLAGLTEESSPSLPSSRGIKSPPPPRKAKGSTSAGGSAAILEIGAQNGPGAAPNLDPPRVIEKPPGGRG